MIDWIIVAWYSGNILKVLFVLLLVQFVTVGSPHNYRSVIIVDFFILWLRVLRNGHWSNSLWLVVLEVAKRICL